VYVFQRTANFSVPAQNGPISPETTQDWRVHRAEYRDRARRKPFALLIERGDRSALEVPPDERQRTYEDRWRHGGLGMTGAFIDLIVNKEANDTAAEFVRAKI